jgi:hemolysin activation/secretion protein
MNWKLGRVLHRDPHPEAIGLKDWELKQVSFNRSCYDFLLQQYLPKCRTSHSFPHFLTQKEPSQLKIAVNHSLSLPEKAKNKALLSSYKNLVKQASGLIPLGTARKLVFGMTPLWVGMACVYTSGAWATSLGEQVAQPSNTSELFTPLEFVPTPSVAFTEAVTHETTFTSHPLPAMRQLQAQNLPPNPPNPENLQRDPNRDRFLQPTPTPLPSPATEPEAPLITPPAPTRLPTDPAETVQIERLNITGSTVFDADDFDQITQPFEGRAVTLEELRSVADAITQLYLDQGYLNSRAILVDQVLSNGVVEIRVFEGSLERIDIEGIQRLNPEYIRSRLRLGAGTPLKPSELEDKLRLLRNNPLFENVEASLRAGTGLGQSILVVRVTEANPFEGSLGVDNYSPPSVGSERLGVNLRYRNLTGNGDEIAASYYHTTRSGADTFDFSYQVPVNPMNGTLQLRTAQNRNEVVQEPFNAFGIEGESELYEISFRQPLIRSSREEFALSLGFTLQDGQTFTFAGGTPFGKGPEADGQTRTRVVKFGQEYVRRDISGAWSVRSLFNFGIDVLNATRNPDPTPDGSFVSWLGQVQRVQVLNDNNFLIIGADLQLTLDSLLSSQQFVIGGGQSLRGYRQNARAGDNGFRVSIEDRITLERDEAGIPTFQLAPFIDLGTVWNVSDNPNNGSLPRQRFLAGIGVGVLWQPLPKVNLRLDYGLPLVNLDDRGNNAQDNGFYFSVNYQF